MDWLQLFRGSRNEHYGAVLAAMQAIAPRNEIEGMLAAQMVTLKAYGKS